jgi:glycosyltransferase involved in cell wall biosynthesis
MKLGFSCVWGREPSKTWSYTPWNLRAALARHTDVCDAGIWIGRAQKLVLRARALRYAGGRFSAEWNPSTALERFAERQMRKELTLHGASALLQIGEIAQPGIPYFLYHDLLVMPSRFEGFGIVFAEALAHGMPAIGRNAYAMPEIIVPGKNGALLERDDARELADLIQGVLENDDVYRQADMARGEVARYYSWDRVAREMIAKIEVSAEG